VVLHFCVQGKDLSEAELQSIIAAHDLNHDGVFDEVARSMLCWFSIVLFA
jgi:hypothetical protein